MSSSLTGPSKKRSSFGAVFSWYDEAMYWLKRKMHPTWHFTVWCLGIVGGLACGLQPWIGEFQGVAWLLLGLALFVVALMMRWRILLVVALIGGLVIGLWRAAEQQADLTVYQFLVGSERAVTGVVSEDPDADSSGHVTLRLDDISIEGQAIGGTMWVSLDDEVPVRRSDTVTLRGEMSEGFGAFSAAMYRAEVLKIERPVPGDVALTVRDNFGEHVRAQIDEPAASLGMGYVAGQRRSLPPELDEALRMAGLTHVVVASGYNLTILVRFARRLFSKASRFLALFTSLVLVVGFIAVTGLSPSMMRAGLVAGLALFAWYFGRKFHPLTLIALAAAATGLINPSYVWGNLGWQLSFLSFAGVMILAPLLQAYFFGSAKPGTLRQIIGETFSAQLMTAPLLLYAFGSVSVVALAANVLVLPLVPLAMLLVFLVGVFGYVLAPVAWLVAFPTQWLLDYMVWVAMWLSSFEWSQLSAQVPLVGIVMLYVVLIGMMLYMKRATGLRLRDSSIVE